MRLIKNCFNSTMGWLEASLTDSISFIFSVSIPLWDDWKRFSFVYWQSHNAVSIPLWDDWKCAWLFALLCSAQVSIPLWDDWKRLIEWLMEYHYLFQFHYGMIGSRRFPKPFLGCWVSIPLWDDWKRLQSWAQPPAYCVSIPLWDDWKHQGTKKALGAMTFQFHYGMIGRTMNLWTALWLAGFNSTMGWLEDNSHTLLDALCRVSIPLWDDWKQRAQKNGFITAEFQFHYGMIGRGKAQLRPCRVRWFQFHYGMIGSDFWAKRAIQINEFQFHYGMIGRERFQVVSIKRLRFNSTMGWLEGRISIEPSICFICFNSTMGWLEVVIKKSHTNDYISFNSTMGWLEAAEGIRTVMCSLVSIPLWDDWKRQSRFFERSENAFQFHYGMIGSFSDDWKLSTCVEFQFHYGMIGSHCRRSVCGFKDKFQFHYGMIGSLRLHQFRQEYICFNSTMGWLEVSAKQAERTPLACFNSTMGWLEAPYSFVTNWYTVVSIPLWDDWKHLIIDRFVDKNSFNSTMGWLEGGKRFHYSDTLPRFQFHYGMIGRRSTSL